MDQECKAAERQEAAEAISRMEKAIGMEKGIIIERCSWDLGQDFAHEYAHRLELFTEQRSVRIYLSDAELMRSGNAVRQKHTERRLADSIDQLLVHVPAPTYAFK